MPFLPLQENSRERYSYMGLIFRFFCYCLLVTVILSCSSSVSPDSSSIIKTAQPDGHAPIGGSNDYQASNSCKNCHANIYEQYVESMHSRSFENPIVKTVFFDVLLPRAKNNNNLSSEVSACIACHAPLTFVRIGGDLSSFPDEGHYIPGVECDLCHTVSGYTGSKPEGGNFISKPSVKKLGPFQYKEDHHRSYSELHTKSEFCAICHNRTNRYGLEIISTFSEWKESAYAEQGIECQDCHMNVQGFLTAGKPVYESGTAAQGTLIDSKKRDKLYTHRFPGAHSESQVIGAITLDIQIDASAVEAGKDMMIYVAVDNSKSGHKLPTGSAELRLLYLDLVAEVGGRTVHIAANSLNKEMFDVSGKGRFDSEIIGKDILPGSRIYRAICIDPEGQQALFSFDAKEIIFDNRLEASEIRQEFFTFQVPDDVGMEFTLVASLKYLRYPRSLADRLGIARANAIELATVRKEILLNGNQ
jgi:cytochrome c554/c'-like protein